MALSLTASRSRARLIRMESEKMEDRWQSESIMAMDQIRAEACQTITS